MGLYNKLNWMHEICIMLNVGATFWASRKSQNKHNCLEKVKISLRN